MTESNEETKLRREIEQVRGEMGETVEALAHKANVPARAAEFKDDVVARGVELKDEALERGAEFENRVRGTLARTGSGRWVAAAGAGLAVLGGILVFRKVQNR